MLLGYLLDGSLQVPLARFVDPQLIWLDAGVVSRLEEGVEIVPLVMVLGDGYRRSRR